MIEEAKQNSEIPRSETETVPKIEVEHGCFVCHGSGHWARECRSLPSIYLTEDAPKCYKCGGVGHFARFCPTSEKQFRHRERRSSFPSYKYPEWGNYFGELMNFSIPTIPDQIFLIRPEYADSSNAPSPFENVDEDDYMSDCSSVDYIVEDANASSFEDQIPSNDNLIEVSIETHGK